MQFNSMQDDASDFGVRPGTAQTIEMDALCELSKAGSSLVSNLGLEVPSPIPSDFSFSSGSLASTVSVRIDVA